MSETAVKTFQDSKGRAITAAAQILQSPKISKRRSKSVNGKGLPWQQQAWGFVDEIGEFSWAVELLATNVSKVQLVAARDVLGVDEPVMLDGSEYEVDGETRQPTALERDAADLIGAFAGGTTGQQQLLYRCAFQLIVAAESYIVGRQLDDGDSRWDAYSNEEVTHSADGWSVSDGTEEGKFKLGENDVLIRVWRPHPKRRSEPRSSTKPLLPVLSEIKGLTQSIAARIDSRLAGAGVLFVPESLSLMSKPSANLAEGEDPFVAELIDSMLTPIHDRDSAAAVVPIVVRIPDDAVGKIQHLRFEVTAKAEEAVQRADAILRMARAVDLPPEQVLGMGDTNHWSAWQLSEDTVKGPVATLVSIVVHALTVGYLRPALLELGHAAEEVDELLTWFDMSTLIQRPDKSENAFQAYNRGGMGLSALLREAGFDDADLPTEEDTCRRLLLKLIETDPANASKWVQAFGPCSGLDLPLTDLFGDGEVMMPQQPPPVVDDPQNNRDIPEMALAASAAACPDPVDCLYATCEVAVLRALDLAGKRLRGSSPRNIRSGLMSIPTHELHANPTLMASSDPKWTSEALLEGAWGHLDLVLPGRHDLIASLNVYVQDLLSQQDLHDPDKLRPIVARHA